MFADAESTPSGPEAPNRRRRRRDTGHGTRQCDDRPTYWATGTYDPDRYYGAVREYGHDYMNYIGDSYGDLDTYESNHPH